MTSDSDLASKWAEYEIDAYKSSRDTISKQGGDLAVWLLASLLAVNGGSILSILGVEFIPLEIRIFSCIFFISGIVLALLNGVLMQYTCAIFMKVIVKRIEQSATKVLSDEPNEETDKNIRKDLDFAKKLNTLGPIAGWLSGLCFLVGVIYAGCHISAPSRQPPLQAQIIKTK